MRIKSKRQVCLRAEASSQSISLFCLFQRAKIAQAQQQRLIYWRLAAPAASEISTRFGQQQLIKTNSKECRRACVCCCLQEARGAPHGLESHTRLTGSQTETIDAECMKSASGAAAWRISFLVTHTEHLNWPFSSGRATCNSV